MNFIASVVSAVKDRPLLHDNILISRCSVAADSSEALELAMGHGPGLALGNRLGLKRVQNRWLPFASSGSARRSCKWNIMCWDWQIQYILDPRIVKMVQLCCRCGNFPLFPESSHFLLLRSWTLQKTKQPYGNMYTVKFNCSRFKSYIYIEC